MQEPQKVYFIPHHSQLWLVKQWTLEGQSPLLRCWTGRTSSPPPYTHSSSISGLGNLTWNSDLQTVAPNPGARQYLPYPAPNLLKHSQTIEMRDRNTDSWDELKVSSELSLFKIKLKNLVSVYVCMPSVWGCPWMPELELTLEAIVSHLPWMPSPQGAQLGPSGNAASILNWWPSLPASGPSLKDKTDQLP